MADYDDDRPKRSWREIDQMRDKSGNRSEPRSGGGPRGRPLESTQAYRAYKTQLNKVFDGGGLPEALKSKLDETSVGAEAKAKKKAGGAIVESKTLSETKTTLEAFRQQFGFPQEEEVLARLIDVSDEDLIRETLETLVALVRQGPLKKANLIKSKVKTVLLTVDEPEVQKLGKELLASL